MILSSPALANDDPLGLNATLLIRALCSLSVWMCFPVFASQRRMVLSPPALTNKDPSGLNVTLVTSAVCPVIRKRSLVVCASYIQIPMALATAKHSPSGENAISVGFRTSLILPFPNRDFTPWGRFHCL